MNCYWCRNEILPSQKYEFVGNEIVHEECLTQWKKDDPLEFTEVSA